MRRLSKKEKKVSEVKQENGDGTEALAENNITTGSKTRKSRLSTVAEKTPSKRAKRESDEPVFKEIEKVIGSRSHYKKLQYKVRWRNFPESEDTWEPAENVDQHFIDEYKKGKDESDEDDESGEDVLPKSKSESAGAASAKKNRRPQTKSEREYEVESILAVRTMKNRRRYKVHWKGCSEEEDSWISENKLSCPEILQEFLRKQKEKKNLPKPINVDSDSEEYEVEKVLEVRFKKTGAREFLIRWKGFSSNDDTWEPEDNLNCPDLITKFMAKVEKAKSVTNRELRANPVVTDRLTLNMKSASLRYSRRPQTQNRPTYHIFLD